MQKVLLDVEIQAGRSFDVFRGVSNVVKRGRNLGQILFICDFVVFYGRRKGRKASEVIKSYRDKYLRRCFGTNRWLSDIKANRTRSCSLKLQAAFATFTTCSLATTFLIFFFLNMAFKSPYVFTQATG